MTEKRFKAVKNGVKDIKTGRVLNGWVDVALKLNELYSELMDCRTEKTKNKLVLIDIIEDLEKEAKTEEPIVISKDYVKWVKENVDLKF